MTEETIEGAAQNGQRAQLAASFYTGPAGLRDRGEGLVDIAYVGSAPKRIDDSNRSAKFGDKAVKLLAVLPSRSRGMTVLSAMVEKAATGS